MDFTLCLYVAFAGGKINLRGQGPGRSKQGCEGENNQFNIHKYSFAMSGE